MKQKIQKRQAFTLIELLTVIVIIGLLMGLVYPLINNAMKRTKVAASKVKFNQYVNALEAFKSEYRYYPFNNGSGISVDSNGDTLVSLIGAKASERFIKTLSGRDPDTGDPLSSSDAQTTGNRRRVSFYNFDDSEFYQGEATDNKRIADAFNNPNIKILIDHSGDGRVHPMPDSSKLKSREVHTSVVVWVDTNENDWNSPVYGTWD